MAVILWHSVSIPIAIQSGYWALAGCDIMWLKVGTQTVRKRFNGLHIKTISGTISTFPEKFRSHTTITYWISVEWQQYVLTKKFRKLNVKITWNHDQLQHRHRGNEVLALCWRNVKMLHWTHEWFRLNNRRKCNHHLPPYNVHERPAKRKTLIAFYFPKRHSLSLK